MVAVRIQTYDATTHRVRFLNNPDTVTGGSKGTLIDLDAWREVHLRTSAGPLELPVPAGLYDQELSEAAASEMEQILQHRIGQPTRSASDLPEGDVSVLFRRRQ